MKKHFLLLVVCLMFLYEASCFHRPRHRKRSKILKKRVPTSKTSLSGSGDRETLKEALKLLNVGKKTLGLNTEDPELLLQLVENPNDKNKSESIEKLLEDPKQIPHAPVGKQYLALSGKDDQVKVDNFTNITPPPGEKTRLLSNDTDIQDIFKMVMEKKAPESQSKVFHKITIIETNQLKPYSNKELLRTTKSFKRRRRHKGWHTVKKFQIHPHVRQRRSKFAPILNFFHRKHSANLNDRPLSRKQISERSNFTNWQNNDDSRLEISLSKFPNPVRVNRRIYIGKNLREPNYNFRSKDLLPSGNDRFKRKESIKDSKKESIIVDKNIGFADENLERLLNSIEFGSSLNTVFAKTTPKTVTATGNLMSTISNDKASIATTKREAGVDTVVGMQKRDIFSPPNINRYTVVERIIPLEQEKEPILSHVLEVVAIMIITLLCFIIVLMVYSKLHMTTPVSTEKTSEKRNEQMIWKNLNSQNKICGYNGLSYKKVTTKEDEPALLNLEWQSESGDWLSEIDDKENL